MLATVERDVNKKRATAQKKKKKKKEAETSKTFALKSKRMGSRLTAFVWKKKPCRNSRGNSTRTPSDGKQTLKDADEISIARAHGTPYGRYARGIRAAWLLHTETDAGAQGEKNKGIRQTKTKSRRSQRKKGRVCMSALMSSC